jgi:hypothetical protein
VADPEPNERGERLIWLEDAMANRLGAIARTGREPQRRDPAAGRARVREHSVEGSISGAELPSEREPKNLLFLGVILDGLLE